MFKVIRISLLLMILFFVAVSTWLTQARSTDWNNSLWVKIYPINADGSTASSDYIASLTAENFGGIETFLSRETERFGRTILRPVRLELGNEIHEQPPPLATTPGMLDIMIWSIRMRWWASSVASPQDDPDPDVRIFVRYHAADDDILLENSVGLQKGMVGIVNAYSGRAYGGMNNVIIAHEFLHTLGATDKYNPADGMPNFPSGYAEPDRNPLYPQRYAEIMGGRIAESEVEAMIPKSLNYVTIGRTTAEEIRLLD
jgi:hypothetical protein